MDNGLRWLDSLLSDPTVDRRFDSEKQHTNDQKLNLKLVEKLKISVKSI